MIKIVLLLIFFLVLQVQAQKEFWGTMHGTINSNYHGYIFKTDGNGENLVKMHTFDSINGKQPDGPLFLASNWKLYGTTTDGGYQPFPAPFGGGVLYEYDLILDKFKVLNYFRDATNPNLSSPINSGVIEPTAGTLIGTVKGGGTFKYTINTETTTGCGVVPSFYSDGSLFSNELSGKLTKGSNGFVYGTARIFSTNPNGSPFVGCIVKINPTSCNLNMVYPFQADVTQGQNPRGGLIEALPNKYYGTTYSGGLFDVNFSGQGVLYEYNALSNVYTKKITFEADTIGAFPSVLVQGINGNLYGTTVVGGFDPASGTTQYGTIFEYNPTTNLYTTLHHFTLIGPMYNLLMGTDGNLYGINISGVCKFDLTTNTLTQASFFDFDTFPGFGNASDIIEICRKPSYQEIVVNSFTINTGSNFTYNVHNTNASSYQWQQNNVNLPGQTTGVLNLTNVTTTNTGVYTCVMTNECGTTITAPLTITVSNLGLNEVEASLVGNVKLYPNPSNNYINIELPTNIDVKINTIKINDVLGKEVLHLDEIPPTVGMTKVDVSNLSKGIYFVSIQTNYGAWNGKFVKE